MSGTVFALGGFLVGSAAIVGGLMLSAEHLADKSKPVAASAPSADKQKIGTAMEHLRPPPPAPLPVSQASVVATRTEPAAEPVTAPSMPALLPGRAPVQAPAATVQASTGVPAIIEETAPPPASVGGDKFPKGSRGCTTYRSYDPRTQTFRAFDGTIKPCRPEG